MNFADWRSPLLCLLVGLLIALLAACGPIVSSCEDYRHFRAGEYLIANNVWGKAGIGTDETYEQCIWLDSRDAPVRGGWDWSWPVGNERVKAYPEIIYGWSPWSESSTTPRLPVRLAELGGFIVSYDTTLDAPEAVFNTSFDLWLTSSLPPSLDNRTHEVMIWVNQQNWSASASSVTQFLERTSIDEAEYDVWKTENSWDYIAFRKVIPTSTGTVRIGSFLDYLVRTGHIPASAYLASIEFGNEVVSGTGRITIRRYEIKLLP